MERLESEELRVLPPLCLAHGSGAVRRPARRTQPG